MRLLKGFMIAAMMIAIAQISMAARNSHSGQISLKGHASEVEAIQEADSLVEKLLNGSIKYAHASSCTPGSISNATLTETQIIKHLEKEENGLVPSFEVLINYKYRCLNNLRN